MNAHTEAANSQAAYIWYQPTARAIPLVLDSPHSSSHIPEDMGAALPQAALRDGEDVLVDELWKAAPQYGAHFLVAAFSRIYIDPNRHLADLDDSMLDQPWPHELCTSHKAGIGKALIWRNLDDGRAIYERLLSVEEVEKRINRYARPYQKKLGTLIQDMYLEYGHAYHINCHSMNAVSGKMSQGGAGVARADVVLGDRDGSTCDREWTAFVAACFKDAGYDVAVNDPFKGVELVRAFSDPTSNRHSLQIELNKRLYLQADGRTPSAHFQQLQNDLSSILQLQSQYILSKIL